MIQNKITDMMRRKREIKKPEWIAGKKISIKSINVLYNSF